MAHGHSRHGRHGNPTDLARLRRAGLHNVTPVLGLGDDPLLPAGACHLAVIVNAYHHFADGPALPCAVSPARWSRAGAS